MRVLIASSYVPFRDEGPTIEDSLAVTLRQAGHQVDSLLIPLHEPGRAGRESTLVVRMLDLSESCCNRIDRVIALRQPAQAVVHSEKVIWVIGPDGGPTSEATGGCGEGTIPETDDGAFLGEARALFAATGAGAGRLASSLGVVPDRVLYAPPPCGHPFRPGPFGSAFVALLGHSGNHRGHLAIEALSRTPGEVRLIMIGGGTGLEDLVEHARREGLTARIEFLKAANAPSRAERLTGCRGVLALAGGEDQGPAVLEAMHSGKPVIACLDDEDSRALIEDSLSGSLVEADAGAIAEEMARLSLDRLEAEARGRQALLRPGEMGITWGHVAEVLAA
jgi:hypothetical protein